MSSRASSDRFGGGLALALAIGMRISLKENPQESSDRIPLLGVPVKREMA